MINGGGCSKIDALRGSEFNIFIYGLGFEDRSTHLVSMISDSSAIYAIQMPEILIHSYKRNLNFAKTRKHVIEPNLNHFVRHTLPKIMRKKRGPDGLRIGFDISSINRVMLAEILMSLARECQAIDNIEIFYCPAAYSEPDWRFPQIERFGPINEILSSYNADPTKPLCLMMGVGFEPGVSMGIISHLEPQICYCFWGGGVDARYDRVVKRANFGFEYTGFNVRVSEYKIPEPRGSFAFLESVTYGLVRDHRLIIIPMGPKLFAMYSILLGMLYPGDVAVWRIQHSRQPHPNAKAGKILVRAKLSSEMLMTYSEAESRFLRAVEAEA